MFRVLWLTSVGGFFEEQAAGAVLGVCCGLVFDIGHGADLAVASEQFDDAVAVFASELGVAVGQGDGHGLDLPEGLIASANLHATTFYFALIDLFAFDCHYCTVPT